MLLEPARGAESGPTARTGTRREIGRRNDDETGSDERLVDETTTEKIRREIGQRNDDEEYPTRDWTTKRPRREHDLGSQWNCGGEARTRKATQSPPTVRFLMSFVPRKNTKGSKQELRASLTATGANRGPGDRCPVRKRKTGKGKVAYQRCL